LRHPTVQRQCEGECEGPDNDKGKAVFRLPIVLVKVTEPDIHPIEKILAYSDADCGTKTCDQILALALSSELYGKHTEAYKRNADLCWRQMIYVLQNIRQSCGHDVEVRKRDGPEE